MEATAGSLFPNKEDGPRCPTIVHGEPLTDRKSTFQAHVAAVTTVKEVGSYSYITEKERSMIGTVYVLFILW